MSLTNVDLILHPVRLRILQTLHNETFTTQEISDRLFDVPKSSIYRHLKVLHDNHIVKVAETRIVNGIQEKTYQLGQSIRMGPEDMAGLNGAEHLGYFTTYVMSLLRDFGNYLEATEADTGKIDMLADRVGYTEVTFYATKAELDQVGLALNQTIIPLLQNKAGNGRFKHKFSTITHPLRIKGINNE
jgi:DNA-binding transcriptional ArsR family regulator